MLWHECNVLYIWKLSVTIPNMCCQNNCFFMHWVSKRFHYCHEKIACFLTHREQKFNLAVYFLVEMLHSFLSDAWSILQATRRRFRDFVNVNLVCYLPATFSCMMWVNGMIFFKNGITANKNTVDFIQFFAMLSCEILPGYTWKSKYVCWNTNGIVKEPRRNMGIIWWGLTSTGNY